MAALYKQQIGALIRDRRKELGLTQRQLADRVQIQEAQTVSRWERGERHPTDLEAVATALEWTIAEMMSQLAPIGHKQRTAMDKSKQTQLDRVEEKLDDIRDRLDGLRALMTQDLKGAPDLLAALRNAAEFRQWLEDSQQGKDVKDQ